MSHGRHTWLKFFYYAPGNFFVGRITKQKEIMHLIRAISLLDPGVQVVLCASAPDTSDIAAEMKNRVETARQVLGRDIYWLSETIPLQDLPVLYSHADVFVCPSIYDSASSTWRQGHSAHRWWRQLSGGFQKWWSMRKPGFWFLLKLHRMLNPKIQKPMPRTWLLPSIPCCGLPGKERKWVRRPAKELNNSFPGPVLPGRPWVFIVT